MNIDNLIRRIEDLERQVYGNRSYTVPSDMHNYMHNMVPSKRIIAVNGDDYIYVDNGKKIQHEHSDREVNLVGSLLYIGHNIVIDITYPFTIQGTDIILYDGTVIPIPYREQVNAIKRMRLYPSQ